MRLLIVDNHDSFTYNLVDCVQRATGRRPEVVPNDAPAPQWANYDALIISPGPGTPHELADLGLSATALREFPGPILGVCLGMQAMVALSGGVVDKTEPAHGVVDQIEHQPSGLFDGLDSPSSFVRYHSLAVSTLPPAFRVTAYLGEIPMAIERADKPWWGVQFHPESLLSKQGKRLIANFLELARRHYALEHYSLRTVDETHDPAQVAANLEGQVFWIDSGNFSILGSDRGPGAKTFRFDLNSVDNFEENFFDEFERRFRDTALPERVGPPIPGCDFALGWVGYLGYELGQHAGMSAGPPAPGPDAEFAYATRAVIIDHARGVTHLLAFAGDDEWGIGKHLPAPTPADWETPMEVLHGREDYLAMIGRAQELMRQGHSYEVCLTNRLELPAVADPLAAFIALRAANPTARTGYLGYAHHQLLSTTPELFLSVDSDGVVHSRPIKGTRPRHPNPQRDEELRGELQGPKETAELLMVVDLVRNDLSRVCDGVVAADFGVESYATVHQLMCHVSGHLRPGCSPVDALRAAFPGGSMTGAPKHRTTAIIAELEGTWRGVYSGAFGYLSPTGTADFSMVIRSLVNSLTGASYGMGGAVLVASDPQAEWEETLVKTRPLTRVVGGGI